ncbi:hypothetical protein ACFC3F_05705 [Microbacterium sp. NPDC055910]|uniref:hypothetical protein n=1 Tax=Microbacterium sp. NPDC055910 TaxID=3345659 RepID=UPI0035E242AF
MTLTFVAAWLWLIGSAYQVFTLGAAWRSWDSEIDAAGRKYRDELAPAEQALREPLVGETAHERRASHDERFIHYKAEADRLATEFDKRVKRGRRQVVHTFFAWIVILAAAIVGVAGTWPASV